jgi:prepilin-type processing-associated H-X9-DG protein
MSAVKEPARTVLIGDSLAWCLTYINPASYNIYWQPRHTKRAAISFCDGHVEMVLNPDSLRWQP